MSYSYAAPYEEVAFTLTETGGLGESPTAKVNIQCAWNDRFVIAQDILGNLRTWPKPGPMQWLLPIKSISIVPQPNSKFSIVDNQCVYEKAVLSLNYQGNNASQDPGSGQLYSESLEPRLEYMPMDHKQFIWIPRNALTEIAPVQEGESPSQPMYSMVLKRTLYRLSSIPATVFTAIGGVNNGAYYSSSLGLYADTECLLYKPPVTKRDVNADGSGDGWTLDMEFVYRPNGWNVFWNAQKQDWLRFAVRDYSGSNVQTIPYKPYPLRNFSSLLF